MYICIYSYVLVEIYGTPPPQLSTFSGEVKEVFRV